MRQPFLVWAWSMRETKWAQIHYKDLILEHEIRNVGQMWDIAQRLENKLQAQAFDTKNENLKSFLLKSVTLLCGGSVQMRPLSLPFWEVPNTLKILLSANKKESLKFFHRNFFFKFFSAADPLNPFLHINISSNPTFPFPSLQLFFLSSSNTL